jgi:G3E family GTPase
VNDFAAVDVDGLVMARESASVISIPGGSIFCRCLVGEFIRVLTELPAYLKAEPEGVIVEASGMADVSAIGKMLAETQLDKCYELGAVVAVADPGTFEALQQTLPNISAQIAASTSVIINKTDLFPAETIATVEDAVRHIRPDADIIRAIRCEVDVASLRLLAARPRNTSSISGDYAPCADPNYATISIIVEEEVDIALLERELRGVRGLYRAKGFVRTAEGAKYLDMTTHSDTIFETPGYEGPFHLAVIVRGDMKMAAQEFAVRVRLGCFKGS